MMDEQLIDEVAQHGVIYNRQKYYLNGSTNGGKFETKDEAWQLIAMKLRTDVDTCKKRWKYLRERYVSQRKQGDPPVYEHLSRPYLEKMKFLDQHIQPRKSYRHVPNFLTSPQSANSSSYNEYQALDKSNGSNGMKNVSQFGGGGSGQGHHYHHPDQHQHSMSALSTAAASALETVNGQVKIEADQVFRDFAAAVASQQLQQISQSQMQQQAAAVAAVMADSSQGYQEQYKDSSSVGVSGVQNSGGSLTSTSSSMKSPLSSPLQAIGTGSLHSQQQQHQQQSQQPQQPQQSPASGGSQLPVVHSSSSAAGSSISTSSNMQQMQQQQQQQQSHVYNPKASDDLDSSSTSGNFHMKKPRVQINGHNQMVSNGGGSAGHFGNDSDDDSDDNSHDLMEPQVMMHESHYSNSMGMQRGTNNGNNNSGNGGSNNQQQQQQTQHQQQQQQHQNMFPSNTDFLFQLYQQFPHQASGSHASSFGKFQTPPSQQGVQRLSEHLLGELVTSELLKMNKERKKSAQKRILEILFFDD